MWGVGRNIGTRLQESGVRSVLDFVRTDAATIRKQFSVVLEKTLLDLRGISCLQMSDVDDAPVTKQQILVSRSFGTPKTDTAGIVEAVSKFASRAAEKLRQQGSHAGAMNVFFTTSPFRPNDRQQSVNVMVPLVRPTWDTGLLVAAAVRSARGQFHAGFNYAKAGVMLADLQPASRKQAELDLFSGSEEAEARAPPKDRSALMIAMDALNKRFGRDSVRIGSATLASHGAKVRSWATKQERRSPRYTTRWAEIPVVKA